MVERLFRAKNMSIKDIAEVAGMDEDTVELLVGLRRALKVVWLQAFHQLLPHPAAHVKIDVRSLDGRHLGMAEVDLAEVERQPGQKLSKRVTLHGNPADVSSEIMLDFEVELFGLQQGELKLPEGQTCFSRVAQMGEVSVDAG